MFGKYFEFCKPIFNLVFISLDTIFSVNQYKKLEKGKYRYVFIVLYDYR